MWALYRIDVYGPFRVRLVASLLERLSHEPFSLWRAKHLGDDGRWFGWGLANQQLADLIDRATMTAKTAGKGAKLSAREFAPRPDGSSKKKVISTRDWGAVQAAYGAVV